MKKLIILFSLIFFSSSVFSQSKSYQALHAHFKGKEDVVAFSMGGVFCRMAVRMATPKDDILRKMTKDIRHVRFIVIPKAAFEAEKLSVKGFKNYLVKDSFQELAVIRDNGEIVSVYHRSDENAKDRYFVLVEEDREVVAIEMKGTIDETMFKDGDNRITLNKK